jgi:UrcA family protein
MSIQKTIIAFAAVLSAAAAVPSAHAGSDLAAPQMKVRYGDLNLASDTGVKTLFARMRAQSAAACAPFGDNQTITGSEAVKACRADLMTRGVEQMHSSALAALATPSPRPIQVASH